MAMTPQEALQRTIEHREIFHDEMLDLVEVDYEQNFALIVVVPETRCGGPRSYASSRLLKP